MILVSRKMNDSHSQLGLPWMCWKGDIVVIKNYGKYSLKLGSQIWIINIANNNSKNFSTPIKRVNAKINYSKWITLHIYLYSGIHPLAVLVIVKTSLPGVFLLYLRWTGTYFLLLSQSWSLNALSMPIIRHGEWCCKWGTFISFPYCNLHWILAIVHMCIVVIKNGLIYNNRPVPSLLHCFYNQQLQLSFLIKIELMSSQKSF